MCLPQSQQPHLTCVVRHFRLMNFAAPPSADRRVRLYSLPESRHFVLHRTPHGGWGQKPRCRAFGHTKPRSDKMSQASPGCLSCRNINGTFNTAPAGNGVNIGLRRSSLTWQGGPLTATAAPVTRRSRWIKYEGAAKLRVVDTRDPQAARLCGCESPVA